MICTTIVFFFFFFFYCCCDAAAGNGDDSNNDDDDSARTLSSLSDHFTFFFGSGLPSLAGVRIHDCCCCCFVVIIIIIIIGTSNANDCIIIQYHPYSFFSSQSICTVCASVTFVRCRFLIDVFFFFSNPKWMND